MELRHLRYFVTVADCQSFNEAAKKLHISQPPLSRQIKQLEEELNIELIDRTQRPINLTDAGVFFYEHASRIISEADYLKSMTRRMARTQNTISIGFVSSILYGTLPKVISGFRKFYPNIEVKLYELNSWQQIEALKCGKIDAGFGRMRFEDPLIDRVVLREEKLVAAVPINHKFSREKTTSISLLDLQHEPLLLYPKEPRPSLIDQILDIFEERKIQLSNSSEVRELQVALGLVAAGEGLTLVPNTVAHIRKDEICYIELDDYHVTSPIIISSRYHEKSEVLKTLLKVARMNYTKQTP
ncbi:LysR family transcriptional regulator [Psychrobacter sanguinis]|uniref:LysR family transcriptional regulator n=1 Tax=Psychrobacter sanguinis TaxID=861445 RepID=A0A844M232_9GAMM|nr:LysR family transcriptional regulator [Psychrobacter sanguinis]MUG32863.1 LysR family transcriptional regulator [Psychrobacter sanguinis]